jgi:hypothetical protein
MSTNRNNPLSRRFLGILLFVCIIVLMALTTLGGYVIGICEDGYCYEQSIPLNANERGDTSITIVPIINATPAASKVLENIAPMPEATPEVTPEPVFVPDDVGGSCLMQVNTNWTRMYIGPNGQQFVKSYHLPVNISFHGLSLGDQNDVHLREDAFVGVIAVNILSDELDERGTRVWKSLSFEEVDYYRLHPLMARIHLYTAEGQHLNGVTTQLWVALESLRPVDATGPCSAL